MKQRILIAEDQRRINVFLEFIQQLLTNVNFVLTIWLKYLPFARLNPDLALEILKNPDKAFDAYLMKALVDASSGDTHQKTMGIHDLYKIDKESFMNETKLIVPLPELEQHTGRPTFEKFILKREYENFITWNSSNKKADYFKENAPEIQIYLERFRIYAESDRHFEIIESFEQMRLSLIKFYSRLPEFPEIRKARMAYEGGLIYKNSDIQVNKDLLAEMIKNAN